MRRIWACESTSAFYRHECVASDLGSPIVFLTEIDDGHEGVERIQPPVEGGVEGCLLPGLFGGVIGLGLGRDHNFFLISRAKKNSSERDPEHRPG